MLFAQYLIEPTISLNQRLARVVGVWMTDATHTQKHARAFGPDEQAQAADLLAYVRPPAAMGSNGARADSKS